MVQRVFSSQCRGNEYPKDDVQNIEIYVYFIPMEQSLVCVIYIYMINNHIHDKDTVVHFLYTITGL